MPPLAIHTTTDTGFNLSFSAEETPRTSNKSQLDRGKSVHFADVHEIHNIPLHDKMLDDSVHDSLWFCAGELERIQRACHWTITYMVTGELGSKFDGYCLRGLEHKTPKARTRRMQVKRASWTAVLDEQYSQCEDGCWNPEEIAEKYREYSQESMKKARLMALRDEQDVQRTHGNRTRFSPRRGRSPVRMS
jgi:hypothetical protein